MFYSLSNLLLLNHDMIRLIFEIFNNNKRVKKIILVPGLPGKPSAFYIATLERQMLFCRIVLENLLGNLEKSLNNVAITSNFPSLELF